jgi:hypothetical protein
VRDSGDLCRSIVALFDFIENQILAACLSPSFSLFFSSSRSELLAWFSCCAHEQDPVRSSHFSATDFHLPMKSRSITALVFHATPLLLSCGQVLCLLPVRDSSSVSSSLFWLLCDQPPPFSFGLRRASAIPQIHRP